MMLHLPSYRPRCVAINTSQYDHARQLHLISGLLPITWSIPVERILTWCRWDDYSVVVTSGSSRWHYFSVDAGDCYDFCGYWWKRSSYCHSSNTCRSLVHKGEVVSLFLRRTVRRTRDVDERTLASAWLDYTRCFLFWLLILAGLSNGVTAERINETTMHCSLPDYWGE